MTAASPSRRAYAPRLAPEARREQLLDAALGLALDRGFHAVSIDAVARQAGVTRPVVYGIFADRAAMLAALVDRAERRAMAQLAPALPPVPAPGAAVDPDALLLAGLVAYWSAVMGDPPTWRVVLLPHEGAPPELHARMVANSRVVLRQLRELVEWGLAARGGPLLDPDLFARAVLTLSEGAARLMLKRPEEYPLARLTAFAEATLSVLSSGR